MVTSRHSTVSGFRLPDLWSQCPFPVAYHKNGDAIAAASEEWVKIGCRVFTKDMQRHLSSLMAGQLAAFCYNECSDERLRIVCDFMIVLFFLDDLSDDLITKDTEILADVVMNAMAFPKSYRPSHTKGKEQPEVEPDASRLTRDYWARCIHDADAAVQARCVENVGLYLVSVHRQAHHRDASSIPTTEEFITLRRINSGCKPLFDLLEYSLDSQLPDYVVEHPVMMTMKDCINDFVAFSNDIFSYNVEQARGDTYNLVNIVMENNSLDLQSAVDLVGDMCRAALDNYCRHKAMMPSFGPEIDGQVAAFLRGLESWVSGSLEWSFITPRYFGSQRTEIKKHRWVKLLSPQRAPPNAS